MTEKLSLDRKVELIMDHYQRVWHTRGSDVPITIELDDRGHYFLVEWKGEYQRKHQYLRYNEETGLLESSYSDDANSELVQFLFKANSADVTTLVRTWLETGPDLNEFYWQDLSIARDRGYYVIGVVPYVPDISFCTIIMNTPRGKPFYVHADDGDWRVSSSPDWSMMPEEDENGETFWYAELPEANLVEALFS